MPLLDVLDRLRTRATQRTESAAETLWASAKRLAAGESADPADIESAMTAAGTSVDGFNTLVELAGKRRTWFAAVDRATPARVKRDKLAAAAAAEREAFEQIRRQWLEKAEAFDAQLAVLDRTIQAGDDARDALCSPVNLPPAVAVKITAAIDAHQAAVEHTGVLQRKLNEQREIRDRRTWMAEQKRQGGKHHPLDIDEDERFAKRAVNQIAELEALLRDAQKAVHTAEANVTKCRAAALKT